ncbi:MAG: hypothetical protein R3C97_04770 [Geminicoccaceae bacterium]
MIPLAIAQLPGAVEAKQIFDFREVREGQYRLYVNGQKSHWFDFRKNDTISARISCNTMRTRYGVKNACDPKAQVFNRELQNNAYIGTDPKKKKDFIFFDVNYQYVLGIKKPYNAPDLIPRPVFDFQRVFDRTFDLYVNGIMSRRFDLSKIEGTKFKITKDDLRSIFGLSGNLERIVDREFGNNWRRINGGSAFEIDVSRARMHQFDDTLFYFDQVRKRGFRLFINGRMSLWLNLRGEPPWIYRRVELSKDDPHQREENAPVLQ